MSGTKRFVEQRILKNRAQEAKDASLRRMLTENNILQGHAKSEARVEGCRRSRSAAELRRDVFQDYTYTKNQQDHERKTRIAHFEENLADEIARRKSETLRREMDKRRICDGSEELRALKERLHAAKVNKERAQQLLDAKFVLQLQVLEPLVFHMLCDVVLMETVGGLASLKVEKLLGSFLVHLARVETLLQRAQLFAPVADAALVHLVAQSLRLPSGEFIRQILLEMGYARLPLVVLLVLRVGVVLENVSAQLRR